MKTIFEAFVAVFLTMPMCVLADLACIMSGISSCSTVGLFYSSIDTEAVCMEKEGTQELFNVVSTISCIDACFRRSCLRATYFKNEGEATLKYIIMIGMLNEKCFVLVCEPVFS